MQHPLPIFAELVFQLLVGNIDWIMVSRYSQNSVAAVLLLFHQTLFSWLIVPGGGAEGSGRLFGRSWWFYACT